MDGVHDAVENYVNSMTELQTTIDNFQKTILAEVHRLVEYQSNWVPNGDSLHAHNGPRYAPDDPTLPQPWKGLIDGSSGSIYYWNTETNVTQYEKPKTTSFLPTDHCHCISAPPFPNTNYHHNFSITHPTLPHPTLPHPSHHIPPFTTSTHLTHSAYGYLYPPPYLADQIYPCDPYPNTPHSSPCPSVNYPESHRLDNYAMPSSGPPPSSGAFINGGFSIEKMDHSKASKLKLQLIRAHYNLKPRSPVPMKRKRQLTLSHRRSSQLSEGLQWEKWGACCKAPSIVPTMLDLVLPSTMLPDSTSPLMILDVIVRQDFDSPPYKDDGSMFTLGLKTIVTGIEGFAKFSEGNCSYLSTDPSCQPHSLADESLTDLGNMPEENEQNAIVHHFGDLVVDVDNFSKVPNLFSGLKPIWLSMHFVDSPVCLEVSIPVSYEHGSKHEAVAFNKFMVCSFTVIELIESLRVAHFAHLQATLSDWKVREQNVLSRSKGGFEYEVHLENLIGSLTTNSQKLFVNIHVKGIERKCSVMYHWLPSLNWNQALLLDQEINFQQGFSSLGNDIVLLNYNLCFSAEMHFLGLIASFVPIGLVTSMLTFSHAWDLQIHKLGTRWITTVNTVTTTLTHDLTTEGLMVVLGINSGTIALASLMISNSHFAMMVTSCHLIGGAYSDHAWLYFLMSKNQVVQVILIAKKNHVQRISFMFALTSKNRVIAFVIDICNQERSTGKTDKIESLNDIGANAMVMSAPLLVENVAELATLKHKKEALDDIGLVAFVFASLKVFRHLHFARPIKLTKVVEFPRDFMIENTVATFWLYGVTLMANLKEGWVLHLHGLMEMWVKALIGEYTIIEMPQYLHNMKIFHQLDDTSWKLVVIKCVIVVLQEVNIFYYFVQWAVSLGIIHFGYGFFPFLNECVAPSSTNVANPIVIVCGAKDGHILPWKMATGNLDYFTLHDLLELETEEAAHNALEWLTGLLRHDTHLYVRYLLDIPEIIVAWKNTKFGLVFYFNLSISILDEDLATIQTTLVYANSTTALRHAMWEVMLLFHGVCDKAFPLSLFELAPQQFYNAKLAKEVILDQAPLLNVESVFYCLAKMEFLCVKWFVGQVRTGADSRISKWNCFSNKVGVLDMALVVCPVSATAIQTCFHTLANFAHSLMLQLRIHGCHEIFGGLHASHEQYIIRSFVLDATTQTPLLVNPNDVVVKKGMLTLSSHKLLICTLVMQENIVAAAAKYNTVRGKRLLSCNWRILTAISRHEDMPSFKGGGMIGSLGYCLTGLPYIIRMHI